MFKKLTRHLIIAVIALCTRAQKKKKKKEAVQWQFTVVHLMRHSLVFLWQKAHFSFHMAQPFCHSAILQFSLSMPSHPGGFQTWFPYLPPALTLVCHPRVWGGRCTPTTQLDATSRP